MGKVFTVNILNFVAIVWMFHFLFQFLPPLFIVFVVSDCRLPCWLSMHIMIPCKRFKTMCFFLFYSIHSAKFLIRTSTAATKTTPESEAPCFTIYHFFQSFKTFYRSFGVHVLCMPCLVFGWMKKKTNFAHNRTDEYKCRNVSLYSCLTLDCFQLFRCFADIANQN